MIYLELFSGGSVARQSVKELGLSVTRWYSSEINKYPIQIANDNHDDLIHLGGVEGVLDKLVSHKDIDVIFCGSPCQGFSVAGKQLNFEHEQSKLFFTFLKIYKAIYTANPHVKLLFENVKMKKEWEQIILSKLQEINPKLNLHIIDSALVSAQRRVRMYITDIEFDMPEDRGIVLKDIIECGCVDRNKSYCLDANYWKGGNLKMYFEKSRRQLVFGDGCHQVGIADLKGYDIIKRVYSVEVKCPTLTTMQGGHREPKVAVGRIVNRRLDENGTRKDDQLDLPFTRQLEVRDDDKSNCLTTVQKDNVVVSKDMWRKLTPLECERLQTLPDNYTNHVSNSQRYKMIGNGWTVDVIAHILKGIQLDDTWHEMYNNNKEMV